MNQAEMNQAEKVTNQAKTVNQLKTVNEVGAVHARTQYQYLGT